MTSTTQCAFDTQTLTLIVGRTPLIPVDTISQVFEAEDPLEALRSLLVCNQLLRQAIYVASPTLSDALVSWLSGAPLKNRRAPLRALAYLSRMAFRCTPFGLCAGIGLVDLGTSTTLRVDTDARRTRTRPDMGILLAVAKSLEAGENRGKIRYAQNRAVVECGDRLYVNNIELTAFVTTGHGTGTEQRPVSLKNTDAVRYVRAITSEGQPYSKIVSDLSSRFDAEPQEAEKLLDRLIEAGVVISELRPSPLGDPVAYMLERFEAIDVNAAGRLRTGIELAATLDRKPLQARSIRDLRAVATSFSTVDGGPEQTTQIDLHAPFVGTLKDTVLEDASQLAEYLIRMAPVVTMAAFRKRFEERYEGADRLVPLLELVDPNLGLGFPDEVETQRVENVARDCALAAIACEATRSNTEEVELTSRELEIIIPPLPDAALPDSLEIGFHVVAASREAVDNGDYCIAPATFTGSDRAIRSLGRFADLLGNRALERMHSFAERDIENDAIVAELAFAPAEPRFYNVVIRPRMLKDELQLGIGEQCGRVHSIPLDDLWVGLDKGLFYLWSSSRERRVVPRENHLFVTGRFAPNVCRFLANLQYEGRRMIRGFDWGQLSRLTYLPRVRVGRIVLSPRRWMFNRTDLAKSATEVKSWVEEIRSRWILPRYVLLGEEDNRLLIDLDSTVAPELLFDMGLRGQRTLTLVEALPSPDHSWIRGGDGRYSVEFVASLLPSERKASNSKIERVTSSRAPRSPRVDPLRKCYGLGSPWVFAKLYIGAQAIDHFLANSIVPLVRALQGIEVIDRWFFVRYADPFSHLRLRLRAIHRDDTTLRDRMITAASQWMERDEILRYAFDTYEPEWERYGGETGIDRAERFFTVDSEVCSELLTGPPRNSDELVVAAVESFLPWLCNDDLTATALKALQSIGPQSLTSADRKALKGLQSASIPRLHNSELASIATGQEGRSQLAALFHMHCNRLGLNRVVESRAALLARHVLLGRYARRSQEQFSRA